MSYIHTQPTTHITLNGEKILLEVSMLLLLLLLLLLVPFVVVVALWMHSRYYCLVYA